MINQSSKIIPLGSCAFRQPFAESHCKFLHGYRLQAKIWVACDKLDNKNWVFDFGSFKEIKSLLEDQFDHTTVIAENDPHINTFKELHAKGIIDLRVMPGVGIEKFAEYVLTLTNTYIKNSTNGRCWVSQVEVWEHEQNSAIAINFCKEDIKQAVNNIVANENKTEVKIEEPDKPVENTTQPAPSQTANPLYAKKSTGWSDPFKGTSWGNK
jgi:6-pyruvoyltetrahydropterin/6-carboxytetrahydropterin synthase